MEVIIGLLVSISIASERLVEITKGMIPWLSTKHDDPSRERFRHMALQLLAILAGVATTIMALPILREHMPSGLTDPVVVIGVGILASGGSGFWNAVLTYMHRIKEIKSGIVEQMNIPANALPDLAIGAERVTSNECYEPEER